MTAHTPPRPPLPRAQRLLKLAPWGLLLSGTLLVVLQNVMPYPGLTVHRFKGPQCSGEEIAPPSRNIQVFSVASDRGPEDRDFAIEYTGYLVLPQAGNWRLALDADDGAVLSLDGNRVVDNGGSHGVDRKESSLTLAAGAHAINLCFWQRGGGAYLGLFLRAPGALAGGAFTPPTSDWYLPAGAAPSEDDVSWALAMGSFRRALQVLAVCLLFLGVALLLLQPLFALLRGQRANAPVAWGMGLLALLMRAFDVNGASPTCDEGRYWIAARHYLVALLQGDLSPSPFRWNYEHPAITKWTYSVPAYLFDSMTGAKLLAGLLGALVCVAVTAFVMRVISRPVGVVAGLLLVFEPSLIAHGRVAGHEATVTLYFTAAVLSFYALLRWGRSSPSLAAGIFAGLAVGSRINSLVLVGVMGIMWLGWNLPALRRRRLPRVGLYVWLTPLLLLAIPLLSWPWLYDRPSDHVLQTMSHWKNYEVREFFLGTMVQPPPHYYAVYFLAVTPPLVLVGMAVWPWLLRKKLRFHHLMLWFWFLAPFAMSVSRVKQDGIRYVLPCMVPAVILAAEGLWHLGLSIRDRFLPKVAAFPRYLVSFAVATEIFACAWVHPYYLDYFGEHMGGTGNVAAHRWFEVGWWGEGADEMIREINATAPPNSTLSWRLSCATDRVPLRSDITVVPVGSGQFYLYNDPQKFGGTSLPGYRTIYQVKAAGAVLGEIQQR